jgi:hypothetical protein
VREEVVARGCFHLHTASGRRYRIERRTHGNVVLYDERGREVRRLCAQPHGVPVDDAVLAQKFQLEADEAAFLRVANATEIARRA